MTALVDSFHTLELLPGTTDDDDLENFSSSYWIHAGTVRDKDWPRPRFFRREDDYVYLTMAYGVSALLFSPAILYRWSIKSTSLIWSPLLWIVWRTFRGIRDPTALLERIWRAAASRIAVAVASTLLAAFVVKFFVMVGWDETADWINSTTAFGIFDVYVAPRSIPPWQWATAINSAWTIAVFLFANNAIVARDTGDPYSATVLSGVIRTSAAVQNTLSCYTIACTLYITVQTAIRIDWPPLGDKLFPWM